MIGRDLQTALLSVLPERGAVSITGAGGKTSLLCLLAKAYARRGARVLVTTSTKMQHPDTYPFPVSKVFLDKTVESYVPHEGEAVFYARPFLPEKVQSPTVESILSLGTRYDIILCEADGARRCPLKYHTSRDPVVLPGSFPLAVMGLSGWGKRREDACFGYTGEGVVDLPFLDFLAGDPEGALKGGAKLLLLNQYETLPPEGRSALDGFSCPVPAWCVSVLQSKFFRTV